MRPRLASLAAIVVTACSSFEEAPAPPSKADAGSDADAGSASGASDAGAAPRVVDEVACGAASCEKCCFGTAGTPPTCDTSDCPGITAECDQPEDCAGGAIPDVCCADTAASRIRCSGRAECAAITSYVVCTKDSDCVATSCRDAPDVPGLKYCQ